MYLNHRKILPATLLSLAVGLGTPTLAQTNSFEDHNGDTVEIPQKVERIATAWPVIASIIVALDKGPQRLVAIPKQLEKIAKKGVASEIFPEMKKVSTAAVDQKRVVIIEEMLKLNPDVIFEQATKSDSIKGMRNAGFAVFALKPAKVDLDKKLVKSVGNVIGRKAQAKEILDWRDQVFTAIEAKTSAIPADARPSYVYLAHREQAIGPKHHTDFFLRKAGGKNAVTAEQNFVGYDVEMLLQLDPDFVFLHAIGAKKTPEDFYNDPVFADLKAVKNKTIYRVPNGVGVTWDGPSQEYALSLEWFTRVMQGSDFLDGSMRESIKAAYPMLYGKEITDKQVNMILKKGLNKGSAGYGKITQ